MAARGAAREHPRALPGPTPRAPRKTPRERRQPTKTGRASPANLRNSLYIQYVWEFTPPPPSERAGTHSHILKNAFLPLVFLSFPYKTIKNLILYTIGRPLATVHPFACFFITFPPVRALSANPLSEATFAKRCTLKRDIGRDTARMQTDAESGKRRRRHTHTLKRRMPTAQRTNKEHRKKCGRRKPTRHTSVVQLRGAARARAPFLKYKKLRSHFGGLGSRRLSG